MSSNVPPPQPITIPAAAQIAVVAARFNADIVEELLSGCRRRLAQLGVGDNRVEIHRVPGAFELPVAAKALGETKKFSAVICLGCVIRGDTPHFEYVAGEAARGISQVGIELSLPVIFGVLTTETHQQALDRVGGSGGAGGAGGAHGHAGERAAEAAAEMIALLERIRR